MIEVLWSIYGTGNFASNFVEGLRALGEDCELRNGSIFDGISILVRGDVMVMFGAREAQRRWMQEAEKVSVPVVLCDLGYVHRYSRSHLDQDRYVQVGLGTRLNWIPPDSMPPARRRSLGIEYPGHRRDPCGHVLVCGQVPGDPTHPHKTRAEVDAFFAEVERRLPGEKVKFRPHPHDRAAGSSLEEDLSRAKLVVTWSSNVGHDALLAGVPVVSVDGLYTRDGLCSHIDRLESLAEAPRFPSRVSWEAYFDRLCWAQWTLRELTTGGPQLFIMEMLDAR